MVQYAYFDKHQAAPQPVIGWYDTAVFNYPNLPDSDSLVEITSDQWNNRMSGPWAVSDGDLVSYTPPSPPPPTLAQQAQALLAEGLAITSTGDSDLNASYPCDFTTQQQVLSEVTSILLNGTFTDGTTSIEWLDTVGHAHAFSIDQFKALSTAIGAFVAGCTRCINGQSTTLPSASATIP